MDTDVEVLKPLDKFLEHRAFTGCENEQMCVTGTMAAEIEHKWIEDLLYAITIRSLSGQMGN